MHLHAACLVVMSGTAAPEDEEVLVAIVVTIAGVTLKARKVLHPATLLRSSAEGLAVVVVLPRLRASS